MVKEVVAKEVVAKGVMVRGVMAKGVMVREVVAKETDSVDGQGRVSQLGLRASQLGLGQPASPQSQLDGLFLGIGAYYASLFVHDGI